MYKEEASQFTHTVITCTNQAEVRTCRKMRKKLPRPPLLDIWQTNLSGQMHFGIALTQKNFPYAST